MGRHRWRVSAWVAAFITIAAWGCGGGKPAAESPTSQAKVTGKVTVKGKPATKGTVTFEPPDYNPLSGAERVAQIQAGGTYEVTASVGTNHVLVAGTEDPEAGAYNTTTFDVKPGTNTLNLDLPLVEK